MSSGTYLEVERKFDVDDSTTPPSFAGIAGSSGILVAAEPVSQLLDAVYFDTPTHDLAANRITLRRRTGGSDAGWHLKLPAGPDGRTEIRAPLGADDTVPTELREVVLAIVREHPLAPVVRISTSRDITVLSDADGTVLAEFCDDRVSTGGQRWREWEIELVAGDAGFLDRLTRRVLGSGAVPAAHASKLARVLGTAPPPVHLDPIHRAVAEQVAELLVWDRAVRADADDAVHQMRVTIRKIRSLARGAPVAPELRWLAGLLGVARDAEVLGIRYRQALNRLPPHLVRDRAVYRLVDGAMHRAQTGRSEALAAMHSARYFALLDGLDALATEPLSAGTSPASIDAAYRRVRKAADAARIASHAGRDEALHRIRKGAKRLRYIAAATDASQVAAQAKLVQSLLGDHQDSVVSRAHLLREAEAAHADGEDTFSYGLLYQQEDDLARRCRAQLDDALADLDEACRGERVGL